MAGLRAYDVALMPPTKLVEGVSSVLLKLLVTYYSSLVLPRLLEIGACNNIE